MNWKIEGGGKKASMEEFQQGQGRSTKTEDIFEEKGIANEKLFI